MELFNSIIIGSCIAAVIVTLAFSVIGFKNVGEAVGYDIIHKYEK